MKLFMKLLRREYITDFVKIEGQGQPFLQGSTLINFRIRLHAYGFRASALEGEDTDLARLSR